MSDSNRQHALQDFVAALPKNSAVSSTVSVRILPDLGHINIRGKQSSAAFLTAVSNVLGQELPSTPNTMRNGDHRLFWLGPDEWLLVCRDCETADLVVQLRESLMGTIAAITDVSGGQIALRLMGPSSRDVLSKNCTVDFHEDVFTVGSCAQTGFAKANILIGMLDDQPEYEIIVRRTFAEYLALCLQHSAKEYGLNFILE